MGMGHEDRDMVCGGPLGDGVGMGTVLQERGGDGDQQSSSRLDDEL